MKIKLLLLTLPVFLFNGIAQQESITQQSLLDKVKTLTSPEFDGRLPGSEGYKKAENYTADFFKDLGLKAFNDSYYQTLYVEYNKINAPAAFKLVSPARKRNIS